MTMEGERLYEYSDAKQILASSIEFCENIGTEIDGDVFVGNIYDVEGKHDLKVYDEWGNSCDYKLIVVRSAADIHYTVGEGESNLVVYDRVYYFKNGITVSISDDLDAFAMFVVYDQNEEVLGKFLATETYSIEKSGRYTVETINHFGVSEKFQIVISNDAPSATLTENVLDKKLEINITESVDADSHIQTLEIYKSDDNGTTWTLISEDDYGTPISLETLKYAFRTTATYKVVLTDEFRTGIDAIEATLGYVQPEPYGELKGVENGGHTNGSASFTWTDEAIVSLEIGDGLGRQTIKYKSGDEITLDGHYILTFENYDGYKMVYTFTIDTIKPSVVIEGGESGASTNNDVCLTIEEEGLVAELFKDGVSMGEYVSGTVITESGSYRLVVSDDADNSIEILFVIDKFVDIDINVNDKGLANDVTIVANEDVNYTLTMGDAAIDYEMGTTITNPGTYSLVVTDEIGNRTEMSFTVVKSLVSKFEHNFDDMQGFEKVLVNGEDKRLNYGTLELFADGEYEVGVVANGVTYTFNITVDGTKPTIKLNGVENGGKTENPVIITDLSEKGEVTVYLNNEKLLYELGNELTEDGKYRVVAKDECGNTTEYTFEIKANDSFKYIALATVAGIGVIGAVVFFILKKKKKF